MSNLAFSLSVFKRLVLQTRKNQGLFGEGLKVHCFRVCKMEGCYRISNVHKNELKRFEKCVEKIMLNWTYFYIPECKGYFENWEADIFSLTVFEEKLEVIS